MSEQAILDALIKQGKLNKEDVEAVSENLEQGFEQLVYILHTMLCDVRDCDWIKEEGMDRTWKWPHHRMWRMQVEKAIGQVEPYQVEELKIAIQTFANFLIILNDSSPTERKLWKFMYEKGLGKDINCCGQEEPEPTESIDPLEATKEPI